MRRMRVVTWACGVGLLVAASTRLFTAEASGPTPPGEYTPVVTPKWPLSARHGDRVRDDALRRAAVRLDLPSTPASNGPDVIECRFLRSEPTGTSAKFDCVVDGGEVVKVKYGRNPEIHAEVAATRLLTMLGYAADAVTIVPKLRCHGCPRYPFFAVRLLSLASSLDRLPPHGHDDRYTDFEWVAVERKFPGAAIETARVQGWAWFELAHSTAPRAEVDALRLLAVFLAHWDNKSSNQRLVCLDPLPADVDRPCGRPVAMLHDLGSTFGPTKVNLSRWRGAPIWADAGRCVATMRSLPYRGATFPEVQISEEGRRRLAGRLAGLDDGAIRALFRDGRFPEFQAATDDERDLEAWTEAFRHRVDRLVTAGPCAPAALPSRPSHDSSSGS